MKVESNTCAAKGGCPNVVLDHHRLCSKHRRNPDKCVRPGCRSLAPGGGVCAGCLTDSPRYCRLEGCPSPRYKTRLCYKHHRESALSKCKHPACAILVAGDYCGTHDIGIDFAAGTWFDWVAAERLFHGRLDGRKPTIPELSAAMCMADKRYVPRNEIGRRLGLDERMWGIWCNQVRSLGEVQGAAVSSEHLAARGVS